MSNFIVALTLLVFTTWSLAWPLYDENQQFEIFQQPQYYEEQPTEYYLRQRRSPDEPSKGNIGVTATHTPGNGGYARAEYNHRLWQNSAGARLDGTAYYQRNWGQPGPRQDYYGGVKLTIPLGRN